MAMRSSVKSVRRRILVLFTSVGISAVTFSDTVQLTMRNF